MQKEWVSYSQLARSSTSRPAECFEMLLYSVLHLARQRHGRGASDVLQGVKVLDSTFFPLGPKRSPWGVWNNRGNSGARLQTLLDPSERLPTGLGLELLSTNDANALGELDLSGLRARTLVFDLGYYSHAHFGRLMEGGVHFLTRLNAQASYRVIANRTLPQEGGATRSEGDVLLSDQTIVLGSPNNRRGALLEGIRLITSKNEKGKVYAFITDRHDLTAQEVLFLQTRPYSTVRTVSPTVGVWILWSGASLKARSLILRLEPWIRMI